MAKKSTTRKPSRTAVVTQSPTNQWYRARLIDPIDETRRTDLSDFHMLDPATAVEIDLAGNPDCFFDIDPGVERP